MKDFWGIGGHEREPEGYFSWQHLVFVSSLMVIMVLLAVFFGVRNKNKDLKEKNKVLIWSTVFIEAIYIFELIFFPLRDDTSILYNLPLFLCSIQYVTIPLAAFSKGRLKEAALDIVFIFGILSAVMGTYLAGNNYSTYPVISVNNVASGLTHIISGFASLYIVISGMESMKKENILISFAILGAFCILAYIANVLLPYNYMFLMRPNETPYQIFYDLVNGNKVLYPIIVVLLFFVYISLYYLVYYAITKKKANK